MYISYVKSPRLGILKPFCPNIARHSHGYGCRLQVALTAEAANGSLSISVGTEVSDFTGRFVARCYCFWTSFRRFWREYSVACDIEGSLARCVIVEMWKGGDCRWRWEIRRWILNRNFSRDARKMWSRKQGSTWPHARCQEQPMINIRIISPVYREETVPNTCHLALCSLPTNSQLFCVEVKCHFTTQQWLKSQLHGSSEHAGCYDS